MWRVFVKMGVPHLGVAERAVVRDRRRVVVADLAVFRTRESSRVARKSRELRVAPAQDAPFRLDELRGASEWRCVCARVGRWLREAGLCQAGRLLPMPMPMRSKAPRAARARSSRSRSRRRLALRRLRGRAARGRPRAVRARRRVPRAESIAPGPRPAPQARRAPRMSRPLGTSKYSCVRRCLLWYRLPQVVSNPFLVVTVVCLYCRVVGRGSLP